MAKKLALGRNPPGCPKIRHGNAAAATCRPADCRRHARGRPQSQASKRQAQRRIRRYMYRPPVRLLSSKAFTTLDPLDHLTLELALFRADSLIATHLVPLFEKGGIFHRTHRLAGPHQTFWPARLPAAPSDSCPGLASSAKFEANCLPRYHQSHL